MNLALVAPRTRRRSRRRSSISRVAGSRVTRLLAAAALGVAGCGPTAGTGPIEPSPSRAATSSPAPSSAPPGSPAAIAGELTRIGSMLVTRAAHTASALPDGRVLVAGGCTADSCEAITATTEIIDPRTGASTAGPDMLQARVGHKAVQLRDGRILLIGGFGAGSVLGTTELFDPVTGTFSAGPDLTEPRADVVALLLLDGSVVVAGGFDGRASVATAEILDADATRFTVTGALTSARSSHTGTLLPDGRVLVTGGSPGGASNEVLAGAELYDPSTGAWSATGEMTTRRYKHAAVALDDGRVLVVGGSDERDGFGRYRSAEIYDPAAGAFAATGEMAAARYKIIDAVVRLPGGCVLVAGGAPDGELFDPVSGAFSAVGGDANTDVSFAAAVLGGDGSVVVTGGYDQSISLTDQVLVYSP